MAAKDLLLGVAVGLFLVGAFFLGRCFPFPGSQPSPEPQRDTLYLRDTITVSEPVYITRRELDTVWVPVVTPQHDTVEAPLVREQVEWSDTLSTVWASGVLVAVDSVRHYVSERVIYERIPVPVKERKPWGLGVTAGYGVTPRGLEPFVGIGVSWTPLRW